MFDKLIDLILQFIKLFQFWVVLNPYKGGVRLRLGKFHNVLTPGFHWMLPFNIDAPLWDNVVTETMRTKPQSLTTKDGVAVVISSVVTFRIEDVKTFLLDVEGRNAVVEDSAYGATSAFIMKKTWDELCAMEDIGNELAKVVRRQAKKYGAEIISVQLVDFARCRSLRLIQPTPPPAHIA
jgi:regulator of protease activity HflC (stomatin/prohibitin superfamily)